jgi:hypothetical protein
MLKQYSNIENINNATNAIAGERYSSTDKALFKDTLFPYVPVTLASVNSSNEFHVYSGESWITAKQNITLTDYNKQVFDKTGNEIQLNQPAKFNISETLKDLQLTSGKYKIVLNFFENIIGSYNRQLLAIDEISPDRTEIRLRAIDETNPHFLVAINQYINNVQQTSLDDDAHERYLLNFSRNKTALFVNSVVVGKYLFVKLYEPISADIEKNFKCWIVRENKLPYIDNISVTEIIQDITFNVISGVNWYASAEQNTSNATTLKSWNDLLGSSLQTSQQIIDSYFSGSLSGVSLNIDFTDFNNFIFYSSAAERLANFKYKVELLEYYTAQSASIASVSGSDAKLNAIENKTLYNNLIGGFDQFEQFLYYQSSSGLFTHDIPLENPTVEFVTGSYISPVPKSNSTYPYELYSVTSSNFVNWYNGIFESASIYDLRNNNRIIRNVPEFMLLDENNEHLSSFVNMLGQHYDILYTYINEMTKINTREEHPKIGMPNELLYSVAKQFGWKLTNGSQSDDLWKYTLGTDINGIPLTGSNSVGDPSLPSRDIAFHTWRRIVNNIPGLLKSKGTKRSIQALLACYGVPQSLITIQEYGGPRLARPPVYEKLNFDYALDLIQNTAGTVQVDYNQPIGSVELRFKTDNVLTNPSVPGTMNLYSAGGNDVTIEFSRGTLGKIQINGTSSADIELFDGSYVNTLLRTGSNGSLEILAKKSKYGKIVATVSASATGSFSNPGSILIGGTTGGSRLQGQVQELRIWSGSLLESPFTNHTKAPSAYDGNIDAYEELVFRTPLTQNIDHSVTSSLTGVQPVTSTISASFANWTNDKPYDSIEETYYFDGISLGAGTFDDNKIRLESTTLTGTLNTENRASLNQFDTAPLDSNRLGVFYSPQTMINEDIISQLGFTLLDDLIGDPSNKDKYSYPDLVNVSRNYWRKYADKNDMNAFLRIFSLFDLSFFKQLEQLLPARVDKTLGVLIQPAIIERSKDTVLTRISKLEQHHTSSINIMDIINITSSINDYSQSINIIPDDFLQPEITDYSGSLDISKNSVLKTTSSFEDFVTTLDLSSPTNISASYREYDAIIIGKTNRFEGTTYVHQYLIYSGNTYITGSTPYWESEAVLPFITASRFSEFAKTSYSSSIGTTLRRAQFQDYLPRGIANHRFNGCKITSPDFNVNSKDTPDGKPVVEFVESSGNRIITKQPGIEGNFDIRE